MDWVRILAYITGTVDQELLLRNEYLAAEKNGFSRHRSKAGCYCRIQTKSRLLKSRIALVVKPSRMWLMSLNPIPSGVGTVSWSHASSMVLSRV